MEFNKKISYAFYTVFHPFKGFWEIKYEGKGNIYAGLFFLGVYVVTEVIRAQYSGYIFNYNYPNPVNSFLVISRVLVLFFLWGISNWCLTTLMDGEGNLKNIITAVGYCLVPMIVANVLVTFLSNFLTGEENMFLAYIDSFTLLWSGLLLLAASIVVHQYTLLKTVFTSVLTIVVMMIFVFIGLLCISLVQQLTLFIDSVYKELVYRV